MLKIPQLIAETNNEVYVKEKNEDFMTLLSGIMGTKARSITRALKMPGVWRRVGWATGLWLFTVACATLFVRR
jgi:hypothetical protein